MPINDIQDKRADVGLVWREVTSWTWETDGYRIERFVPGIIEAIGMRPGGPDRYRVFKRTDAWDFEFAPSETDLESAKRVCERFSRGIQTENRKAIARTTQPNIGG